MHEDPDIGPDWGSLCNHLPQAEQLGELCAQSRLSHLWPLFSQEDRLRDHFALCLAVAICYKQVSVVQYSRGHRQNEEASRHTRQGNLLQPITTGA